jgi:hypothetical protein
VKDCTPCVASATAKGAKGSGKSSIVSPLSLARVR